MPKVTEEHLEAKREIILHDGIDLRWALDPTFDIEACRDVVIAMLKGQFRAELSETFAGRDQSAWTRSELGGVDRLA